MLPGLIIKAGLTKAAEKAFEKAGGVEGLKEKGQKLVANTTQHAKNIANAVQEKNTEKVAEAVGSVAKDVVEVAKDASVATIEIATETVQDAKKQVQEVKKVIKNNGFKK